MKAILGTVLGTLLAIPACLLGFAGLVYYILAVVWFLA